MKKKNFFAHLAQTGLALAAAVLIGMGLMSCNKEKNKPGPDPKNEGVITMTTDKNSGDEITLEFDKDDAPVLEGATKKGEETINGDWKNQAYTIKAQNITIKGKVTRLDCSGCDLTSLDVSKSTKLTSLNCSNNSLSALDVSKNTKLFYLFCYGNKLKAATLSLPDLKGKEQASLYFRHEKIKTQKLTRQQVEEIKKLNWTVNRIFELGGNDVAGEYKGQDDEIIMKTSKNVDEEIKLLFHKADDPVVQGAEGKGLVVYILNSDWKQMTYVIKEKTIIIGGKVTWFDCSNCGLDYLEVGMDTETKIIDCSSNNLTGENLNLPNLTGKESGELRFKGLSDLQSLKKAEVEHITSELNWNVYKLTIVGGLPQPELKWIPYKGE